MPKATRPLLASLALPLLALASCADLAPVGETRQPIINGQVDNGHSSVVALTFMNQMFCSGTVIAPRAVLTAGHCLEESGIPPAQMKAYFGTSVGDGSTSIRVVSGEAHPGYYVRADGAPVNDVAVVQLAEDAPVPPMQWQRTPLGDISGKTVTLVGYGVTNAARQTGDGTRRTVDVAVSQVDDVDIYYGDGSKGTCQGDSGGPMLLDVDGVPTVVGVTSWGDQSCVQLGGNQRVDTMADFITPRAILAVDLIVNHPTDGETVGSAFTVDVTPSTNAGVAEVDVYVDDQYVGGAVQDPFVIDVTGIADGAHVVKVVGTGKDQGTGEQTVNITVATVTFGGTCAADTECGSGVCADAASGNGFCSQTCAASSDCPAGSACETLGGASVCGPPGSASGCQAGGRAAAAPFGLLLLAAVLALASRRRRA